MFIGREKELKELTDALSRGSGKTAILIYGKRRVGKTTLIREAVKSFEGTVINYMCVPSTYEGNLVFLSQAVSAALALPVMKFDRLQELVAFLGSLPQKVLLVLDEYSYLKQSGRPNEVDTYLQEAIDGLPENVSLILCGSYISIMRELLESGNPLFGRFTLIQHIREFDYYDAAKFYPSLSEREKATYYSVFGGTPYVLESIDVAKTLQENIIDLLLSETGIARSYIENLVLREIRKSYDTRILEVIGNGKKKYSEIRDALSVHDNGLLDKQLKILLDMEIIQKTEPINRLNDRRKQFYELQDNLLRFYFTFIFGTAGMISRVGAPQYFATQISPRLDQFISRRFEGIALQYFRRKAECGLFPDAMDFGSYWYDDPVTKSNGEFDVVVRRTGDLFDFYECKFFDRKMKAEECEHESRQICAVKGIQADRIGFVSVGGFDSAVADFTLIDGKDLYDTKLEKSHG